MFLRFCGTRCREKKGDESKNYFPPIPPTRIPFLLIPDHFYVKFLELSFFHFSHSLFLFLHETGRFLKFNGRPIAIGRFRLLIGRSRLLLGVLGYGLGVPDCLWGVPNYPLMLDA